jgi:hypothetical protein
MVGKDDSSEGNEIPVSAPSVVFVRKSNLMSPIPSLSAKVLFGKEIIRQNSPYKPTP